MYSGTRENSSENFPGNCFGRMPDRRSFPILFCLLMLFLLVCAVLAESGPRAETPGCSRLMFRGFRAVQERVHCCFAHGLRVPRTIQQFRKQELDDRAVSRSGSGMVGPEKFHCPKNLKYRFCRKQLCCSASGIFFAVMNASSPVRAGPSPGCGSGNFVFFRFV